MQVSCKVSYSVLVYVERQGAPLERFVEQSETPVEFFKDPSAKVEVMEMERFLNSLADYLGVPDRGSFFREVGQSNFDLRAWGVLDSVLKMVESPKEIFAQPERFLSYFLTPYPELTLEKHNDHHLTFHFVKQPTAQNLMAYLIGAVEGLPRYMGMPPAKITEAGEGVYDAIWYDDQKSLFDEQEKKRRLFHPEIVHSVLQSFKEQQAGNSQGDVPQQMASEAFEKMVSLEVEKRMASWIDRQEEFDQAFYKIKNDFYKMYDYFTRAQQIITLISPTARKASVREAMRRVDWEHVQKEFPKMVEGACDSILAMQSAFHTSVEKTTVKEETRLKTKATNLNELIDQVLEGLSFEEKSLKIDRNLHLDKEVHIDSASFASALGEIFQNSVANSHKDAEMRVVTRSNSGKVQIEITDRGQGLSDEKLEKIFDLETDYNLKRTQEIIQRHRGQISISSRKGEGSTYLIEFPS
jgi:hypothetical protein